MTYLDVLEGFVNYFHEDWQHDYADGWAAVADFVAGQPDQARSLSRAISWLLLEYPREREQASLLFELGLYYSVENSGWDTHREWLLAVAHRVDGLVAENEPPFT